MKKNEISDLYLSHPGTLQLLDKCGKAENARAMLDGLTGSAKALVLASVHESSRPPISSSFPKRKMQLISITTLSQYQATKASSSFLQHTRDQSSTNRQNLQILF
jgi:hypothetical protein